MFQRTVLFSFLILSSLLSLSASADSSALAAFSSASIVCSEVGAKNPDQAIQVRVGSVYDEAFMRVEIREFREDGSPVRVLNDLMPAEEHSQGLYQNAYFRLKIENVQNISQAEQAGHLDLLYDSAVRASVELTCHSAN